MITTKTALSTGKAALFLATAFLLTERNAHAYLDPGSGSYATQIIIASLAGGLFAIKNLIGRFVRPVKSSKESSTADKNIS